MPDHPSKEKKKKKKKKKTGHFFHLLKRSNKIYTCLKEVNKTGKGVLNDVMVQLVSLQVLIVNILKSNKPLNNLHFHMHMHVKTPLEIYFVYLNTKDMYCIFKIRCILSVYIPKNAIYFVLISFSVKIVHFS